jgi:DNA-binding GntR family transcriptional regulator
MVDSRGNRTDGAWPEIESSTLADRVYQVVRQRIVQGDLTPGVFLREQEITKATGVSRTPVREALNRLASQEFLERVPHRGFRVPETPWETLLEVYPIVSALESLAGSLAFERLRPEDIKRLKELNRKLVQAGKRGDSRAQVELNNAFHKVISDRAGNQRLSELLDQLRNQVSLVDGWYFSVPAHVMDSVEEHGRIIEAIEKKDFGKALEMLELNYFRGRQRLEEEIAGYQGRNPLAASGG